MAQETETIDRPSSLAAARREAKDCTRCGLYKGASQTVFGEGPASARLMLVGEQPGDQEDKQGRAFVGPAGGMLDKALKEAGINRGDVYLTNAVKHFKNEPRGKKRLHKKPNVGEIQACEWWLDLELRFVKPKVIVGMGTTALRAVAGRSVTVKSAREEPLSLDGGAVLLGTVHPSYLLRLMRDRERADQEYARFVADLERARDLAA